MRSTLTVKEGGGETYIQSPAYQVLSLSLSNLNTQTRLFHYRHHTSLSCTSRHVLGLLSCSSINIKTNYWIFNFYIWRKWERVCLHLFLLTLLTVLHILNGAWVRTLPHFISWLFRQMLYNPRWMTPNMYTIRQAAYLQLTNLRI